MIRNKFFYAKILVRKYSSKINFLKGTVLTKSGGKLLLIAVILVAFPITALMFPTIQNVSNKLSLTSPNPQSPLTHTAGDDSLGEYMDSTKRVNDTSGNKYWKCDGNDINGFTLSGGGYYLTKRESCPQATSCKEKKLNNGQIDYVACYYLLSSSYSKLSATLSKDRAEFKFSYNGPTTNRFHFIMIGTASDLRVGTYTHFAKIFGKGDLVATNNNPSSAWSGYKCGIKYWWRVWVEEVNLDSFIQGPVSFECDTPSGEGIGSASPAPSAAPGDGSADTCKNPPIDYNPASMACGVNYYGADFQSGPGFQNGFQSTVKFCQTNCDGDINCKAWTWVQSSSDKNSGICWQKGNGYTKINDPRTISGAKGSGTSGGGNTGGGTGNQNQTKCQSDLAFFGGRQQLDNFCKNGGGGVPGRGPSAYYDTNICDCVSGTGGGGQPGGTGPLGTINIVYTGCINGQVYVSANWISKPSQVKFNVYYPGANDLKKSILINSGTSGISNQFTVPGETSVNYSIWDNAGNPLLINNGGKSPVCAAGGGGNPPAGQATNTPTPIRSSTPVPAAATGQPTNTPTIPAGETKIALTLTLKGIGADTAAGHNNNPNPNSRTVNVQVFDANGGQAANTSANLAFDQASSSFKGTASLNIAAGVYKIKVKFDNTLRKAISGVTLTSGQTANVPATRLILGDLNDDNRLDLIDYNLMLSCYGAKPCGQKQQADLNLDGKVDERDLNILSSEFATREGD